MKKTILILILVVYIASIAVVNFFGLEVKVFDGVTYVTEIRCNTVTVQNENSVVLEPSQIYKGAPLFVFDFIPAPENSPYTEEDESILTNPNRIQIIPEVFPHEADNTHVNFEFDAEAMSGKVVFHEYSRSFIFLKPNAMYRITIRSTDGSNISTVLYIMGRIPKN